MVEVSEAERWAYAQALENVESLIEHRMMQRMSNPDVYQELTDLRAELLDLKL